MKKILFLLLSTIAMYGQVPADATPLENIQITNNTQSTTATKVNVQEANGTINTISKSDLVNVVEVNDVPSLPLVGEVGKIYVVKNVNKIYRWNGTFYQELAVADISGKEDIANKQNSLSVDGSNTKYPTVTAVNAGLALKSNDNAVVHLTGAETITGVKTFNDISAVTNYKSSTSNVIISDTDGLVFRGVRSGAWSDSVNTRFFQVGNSNDNVVFNTRLGSAANRMLFSSLKTQISSGNFVSTIVPLGIFEVTNGTNRFFNVFGSGNSVFGGSTDDLTNRLQVTGTVSSGTTALGNTPPTANNQLTRKDYVDTGLALKANLASPALTGTPTAPTATVGTNTTQIATTAFVAGGLATKENAFSKNTAFNKNFGTTAGTVVEGGTLGSNAYTSTAFAPLNGTGANGTWGINISGNSQSSSALGVYNWNPTVKDNADFMFGRNSANEIAIISQLGVRNFLGLGSNAYTSTDYLPLTGGTVNGTVYLNSTTGATILFQTNSLPLALMTSSQNIIGGAASTTDFNTYVYGNNPYNIWTNGIKRLEISGLGEFKINNLSGTGTRNVVADASGNLLTDSTVYAPLTSPALTGTPTAPTAAAGTNTTQIATTAFVQENSRPYKVYTALLSQSGTNAPTAVVLENTLGGTVVWSRTNTGQYLGTLTGAFTGDKTISFFQSGSSNPGYAYTYSSYKDSNNSVRLYALSNGSYQDQLIDGQIEIRVYL